MKEEEFHTVNLRINGIFLSLLVPGEYEPFYRTAETLLDERAIQIKKENALNHFSDAKIGILLALETMVNALQLQKSNEEFQEQIDKYLEVLSKSAA